MDDYVPPPKVRGDKLVPVRIPLVSELALASVSYEPVDGIPPNLSGYIIGTSLRAGRFW